jgi:hypothetical protein
MNSTPFSLRSEITEKSTVDFEKQEISRSSEVALDKSGRQV